jgi:tRNA-modifying protein YgfZ
MLNFYKVKQDYLKFEGTERLDLINRLSTNQVTSLEKLKGIKTILTSDKGRFVDILALYNFGDFIFSACSFNNSKNVLAHLERYTIMDDFKPTDMAGTHETILFYGDEADDLAKKVFSADIITAMQNNDFVFFNDGERHSIAAKNDDAFGGFHFIYAEADKGFWYDKILKDSGAKEVSVKDYEAARIELGIPVYGKEMSDLTNPLECGLNKYVSFTKGCYIGQEVIARLDAYDKISKHMVGIKFIEALPENTVLNEVKIAVDGKECGFVTSMSDSADFGKIGIGFVKTIFLDYTKEYKIKYNGVFYDCKLIRLPFTTKSINS